MLALLLAGCAGTQTTWLETPPAERKPNAPTRAWQDDLTRFEQADSSAALGAVILRLSAWVEAGHADPELLTALAEAHTLHGAAWSTRRSDKRRHFDQALVYSQRALLSHGEFAQALAEGQSPGQAAGRLPREAVPALVIWVTATAYRFDETMGAFQRLRHFRQMETVRQFMERAMVLDPDYEFGVVPFSLAIYHIATPSFAGGDRELAEQLLEKAIESPGISLLPRWGRARYLYPIQSDRQARRQDLEWVLAQDPRAVDSAYRWNVYFQADARRMLDQMR